MGPTNTPAPKLGVTLGSPGASWILERFPSVVSPIVFTACSRPPLREGMMVIVNYLLSAYDVSGSTVSIYMS